MALTLISLSGINNCMSNETQTTQEKRSERLHPLRRVRIGVAVLLAASVSGGIVGGVKAAEAIIAYDSVGHPQFSSEKIEYVVQPGQGVWNAAEQVEGINSIDIKDEISYIEKIQANQAEISRGLQPGDVLEVNKSVKP